MYSRSKVERSPIRSSRPYLLELRTPELAYTGCSEFLPGSFLGRSGAKYTPAQACKGYDVL
eukprot:6213949-Pleurochrysis_carterae.AAC.4